MWKKRYRNMHIYNIYLYLVSFFRMSQEKIMAQIGHYSSITFQFSSSQREKRGRQSPQLGKTIDRWLAMIGQFLGRMEDQHLRGVNTICGLMSKIYQMLCMYISMYIYIGIIIDMYVYIYIKYHISYIKYHISYIIYHIYIYICTHVPGSRNSHPTTLMDRMWDKPQIFARRLGQVDSVFIPPFFMGQEWMKSWRDDLGKQKYHLFLQSIPCLSKKNNYQYLNFP